MYYDIWTAAKSRWTNRGLEFKDNTETSYDFKSRSEAIIAMEETFKEMEEQDLKENYQIELIQKYYDDVEAYLYRVIIIQERPLRGRFL